MEVFDNLVLVVWIDPQPSRETGVTYCFVSQIRKEKSAQNLIGRLTLQNYRFAWSYIHYESDIDAERNRLFNELKKGLK